MTFLAGSFLNPLQLKELAAAQPAPGRRQKFLKMKSRPSQSFLRRAGVSIQHCLRSSDKGPREYCANENLDERSGGPAAQSWSSTLRRNTIDAFSGEVFMTRNCFDFSICTPGEPVPSGILDTGIFASGPGLVGRFVGQVPAAPDAPAPSAGPSVR